jgi:hypothetical protein
MAENYIKILESVGKERAQHGRQNQTCKIPKRYADPYFGQKSFDRNLLNQAWMTQIRSYCRSEALYVMPFFFEVKSLIDRMTLSAS